MSSFPTCQVCQEQFSLKGPAPFLLPCLHAVCETCVTSAAGGVISCSPCQRDVNLTETPLQKDVVRDKEILHLTVQHNPELVLCTHEEDGNQAVCWCEECQDFLCEHCQMVHNSFKVTKQHSVYDVEAMEHGNLDNDKYCTVHPKFMIDTWDKDCSMLTCGKCRLGDHSGHEVVDVEEAADSARKEIAVFRKGVSSTDDQHRSHLAAAEKDLQSPDETTSILAEKISFTFTSLKVQLDQREKELQIQLQNYKADVRDQVHSKKKTSEGCHQRCQITSDYIDKTLQYSSLHDVLELRQQLEAKSQDCNTSAPSEDYKSLPLPVFNTEGLDRMNSTLAQFGNIAAADVVPVAKMTDNGTQTEEDEKLTQELTQLKACQEKIIRQEKEVEKVSGLYRLSTQGTNLKFGQKRYNAVNVHIDADDQLINKPRTNSPYSDQRLKNYDGTSSTAPLPQGGSSQYFEVKSRVGIIRKSLTGNILLLEIGLAREEEQDLDHCVDAHPHSYALNVLHCTTHSSICRTVWGYGKLLHCLPDTLENTAGTSATLHYGVVYNSARSRIAFLDVSNEKMIGKIDNVDSSVPLWPMFGVYNPHLATVRMSLVVGGDIDMTEKKKGMIVECLS